MEKSILEQAIEHYPPGTEYICSHLYTNRTFTVHRADEIRCYGGDPQKIDILGKGYIYYLGKWAEIVGEPAIKENSYQIY
jgi:hypothetical protein